MPNEKRMIDKFEIIHAIQMGAREVVVGISPEQEFMCCFCTRDGMLEHYADAMVSDDYLEIMELYADRLKSQVSVIRAQRNTIHVPLTMLREEQCFPMNSETDITGKVVAIKPDSLAYEYQQADRQLILVTGGGGAHSRARGSAVFGVNVFTGRNAGRWERRDVLGEVKPEHLPQWAKDRLPVIERERALERGGHDAR